MNSKSLVALMALAAGAQARLPGVAEIAVRFVHGNPEYTGLTYTVQMSGDAAYVIGGGPLEYGDVTDFEIISLAGWASRGFQNKLDYTDDEGVQAEPAAWFMEAVHGHRYTMYLDGLGGIGTVDHGLATPFQAPTLTVLHLAAKDAAAGPAVTIGEDGNVNLFPGATDSLTTGDNAYFHNAQDAIDAGLDPEDFSIYVADTAPAAFANLDAMLKPGMDSLVIASGFDTVDDPLMAAVHHAPHQYTPVRFAHAVPADAAVDIWYAYEEDSEPKYLIAENVAYKAISDYIDLPSQNLKLWVVPTGETTGFLLDGVSVPVSQDYKRHTVVVHQNAAGDAVEANIITEENDLGPDAVKFTFQHANKAAPAVAVKVAGADTALATDLTFPNDATIQIGRGSAVDLQLVLASDLDALVLNFTDVDISKATEYLVVVGGDLGNDQVFLGEEVNAFVAGVDYAHARAVHAGATSDPVDVAINGQTLANIDEYEATDFLQVPLNVVAQVQETPGPSTTDGAGPGAVLPPLRYSDALESGYIYSLYADDSTMGLKAEATMAQAPAAGKVHVQLADFQVPDPRDDVAQSGIVTIAAPAVDEIITPYAPFDAAQGDITSTKGGTIAADLVAGKAYTIVVPFKPNKAFLLEDAGAVQDRSLLVGEPEPETEDPATSDPATSDPGVTSDSGNDETTAAPEDPTTDDVTSADPATEEDGDDDESEDDESGAAVLTAATTLLASALAMNM